MQQQTMHAMTSQTSDRHLVIPSSRCVGREMEIFAAAAADSVCVCFRVPLLLPSCSLYHALYLLYNNNYYYFVPTATAADVVVG